jgi:hypothetical protein
MDNLGYLQSIGHLPTSEEAAETCRLFRARCSAHDCEQMSRLRTYIEEGLLLVVRPPQSDAKGNSQ